MRILDYNLNTLLFAVLMSFRLATFFRTMPSFADVQVKGVVSIFLPIGMAFLIAPTLSYDVMPIMTSPLHTVFMAILLEVAVGAIMGFAVNIIISLAAMIGELVGMQAGFSMASLFDPNLGQISVLAYFTRNLFLMVFFMFNIHHAVIAGVVQSYESIPVGFSFISFSDVTMQMVRLFSSMYFLSFRIVLPIIVVITLSHLTMGVISVTAPQMNIYFNAAITLNVVVALILFAISLPAVLRFFNIALGQFENVMGGLFMVVR